MKTMVGLIWFINTLQVIFDVVTVDHYLLKNYANYSALKRLHWSLSAVMFLSVLGCAAIRVFLVHLIWRISAGRWSFRLLTLFFSGLSLLSGLGLAAEAYTESMICDVETFTIY